MKQGLTSNWNWIGYDRYKLKSLIQWNQKTVEQEDDIIAIFMCIWCYKAKSFTKKLNGSVYISQTLCFVHWTIQSLNLSLNVAFQIKSFLVSTFRNLNFVKRLSGGYQKSCQEDLCNVNNSLCLSSSFLTKQKLWNCLFIIFIIISVSFMNTLDAKKNVLTEDDPTFYLQNNWRRPYLLSAE